MKIREGFSGVIKSILKKTKLFNNLIDFAYILIISFSEIVKPSIDTG
jgi:hypothetical protein